VIACEGRGHGLLAQLQLVQQWGVSGGKLAAEVDAGLEHAGSTPAQQGALADAKVVSRSTLGHPGGWF